MFLSRVEIKNFRSIRELTVEFQSGLNVLVGRNNTGKTNLLQAIRFALGPSASQGDVIWLDKDDFYKESPGDTVERTISITLTFSGLSESQRSYFFEVVAFNPADLNKSEAVIRCEASWPANKRQASIKRTGGPKTADSPEVPTRILESLPITFLPALRDAEAALAPGYRSRLAKLLLDIANRKGGNTKDEIKTIFSNANTALENHSLISDTRDSLQNTTQDIAGSDYSASVIKATSVEFEKILRSLQVQMTGSPIGELDANGLGHNNLLYMAVVLEHLKTPESDESPLFLVEEPEAHLHPQLTMLLADFLANKTPAKSTPQTIVTSHSPTLVSSVPPDRIHVLFTDSQTSHLRCNAITKAGMSDREVNELQRMMDVTRATLYFAKAVILVEGVSESLLIPVLAKRLSYDLAKRHISVIPICGVAFPTFKKLLDPSVLGIPVSIVTDADPPVPTDLAWRDALPEMENNAFKLSDRTKKLITIFNGHQTVKTFHSKLTLEYDLAEAGADNALVMAEVWESCFDGTPGTFNRQRVADAGADKEAKALATWRGICRADHSGSKAEFAHRLAAHLEQKNGSGEFVTPFQIPEYLKLAISYVADSVTVSPSSPGVPTT